LFPECDHNTRKTEDRFPTRHCVYAAYIFVRRRRIAEVTIGRDIEKVVAKLPLTSTWDTKIFSSLRPRVSGLLERQEWMHRAPRSSSRFSADSQYIFILVNVEYDDHAYTVLNRANTRMLNTRMQDTK